MPAFSLAGREQKNDPSWGTGWGVRLLNRW